MTYHITMGYDPFTGKQLDAEYHYDDETLFMIKSSTGIEFLPDEMPDTLDRWHLTLNSEELDTLEPIKEMIFAILIQRFARLGCDENKISELLKDSDCSIVIKGRDSKIIWR